uniref:Uncharacterized protein n=1 Tax=viral metagenome TaxID=1070528 RepID=A0A6C0EMC8_9ZZZZ
MRKTKRAARGRKTEETENVENLKAKLRAKLREAKLGRQSQFVLDNRMDKLEEQLERVKTHDEEIKIRKEMELIEKIEEKRISSVNDDFAEYDDNANYGGGMEC